MGDKLEIVVEDEVLQVSFSTKPFLDELLKRMEDSTSVDPQLLMKSAGKKACCIFRVPDSLSESNPEAYKPKVVSIGPYHNGETHLQMIQQHKPRFLKLFLEEARKKGVEKDVLVKAVADLEESIRNSYSEQLPQSSFELVYMMILDGCFILMLLLIVSGIIKLEMNEDPIFTVSWIIPSIKNDLLLLENQVPFSVLQTLLKQSKIDQFDDLNKMVFDFIKSSIDERESYWVKHRDLDAKHLLDLIRMTFVPKEIPIGESSVTPTSDFTLVLSATRLYLQGIKFRVKDDADSILDISLKKNKLQIPVLKLDGFIISIFFNCVAFEQFYTETTNDITSYIYFMGCLLRGHEDATFLSNEEIIKNYFGSENEVSQFFKNICKDVVFDINRSYLRNVFAGVNEYTRKLYNSIWAGFKHTHCESIWICMSSFAVVLVILLTILQATVGILSYRNDLKEDGNAAPPPAPP